MCNTARDYMAKQLKAFRKRKGLSVNEVGKVLRKSGKTISAWEIGHGQPDADKLIEICALYDARISDFYFPQEKMDVSVSQEESELLNAYRQLDSTDRSIVSRMVYALLNTAENIGV